MNEATARNKGFLCVIKNSLLIAVIGIVITLVLTFLSSFALTKCNEYESFYPLLVMILRCLPAFISARIATMKYRCSLIPNALLEAVWVIAIISTCALIFYGNNVNLTQMPSSFLALLASSLIAALLPFKKIKHN